jgi:integrase
VSRTAVLSIQGSEAGALAFGSGRVSRDPVACYLGRLTPSGRRTMAYRLRFVARLFGHADASAFPWAQIRYEHLVAVRSYLVESGRAPATVNAALCAMVGVAREAWRLGLLGSDELERVRSVTRARGERLASGRVVGRDEIAALLGSCRRDARGVAGTRDAAVLALLFGAGLRRCEPCRPSLEAYSPQTGELRVIGKGSKERRVYLAGGAAEAVRAWVAVRGSLPGPLVLALDRHGQVARPSRALTPSAVDAIVRRRAVAAGVRSFSTHDARRTFITGLLERGVDTFTVQELAGHSDPKTTKLYDRRGDSSKRSAAALVDLPY